MNQRCRRVLWLFVILAAFQPSILSGQSGSPPKTRGFALFSGVRARFDANRVACGFTAEGEMCLDVGPFDGIGGGFWPKGTGNNYVYNSGPQIAGLIAADGGLWAGDTAGGFFFDAKGTTQHGVGVTNIYKATDPADAAAWPAEARVPSGFGSLYHFSLQDSVSASEGDLWWLMWEGDPSRLNGRQHPLGVTVEGRILGWNYPAGNEDVMYVVLTYYNITSTSPADYAAVRPALRAQLLTLANRFQSLNNAAFGITLPVGGYTINSMFAGFHADMDVADAGQNYSSINLPLSLGYAYEHSFQPYPGWTFDPLISTAPFFAGTGFVGTALLRTASDQEGTHLFTNTESSLSDARDVPQLFRYLSGTLSTATGDGACNFNPLTTRICYIRQTSPRDIRYLQSTGPFTLVAGDFQSVAAAYVFAAPVRTGGSVICPACDIKSGAAAIIAGLGNPAVVAGGVNPIDSIAGFLGATDYSGDGILQGDEFLSVPRSLYGKTQLAQAIFDNQFLLPSAPAAPDFFLIPGDGKVTVIWRPSTSEQAGDPFYAIAKDAMRLNPSGTLVPNPLRPQLPRIRRRGIPDLPQPYRSGPDGAAGPVRLCRHSDPGFRRAGQSRSGLCSRAGHHRRVSRRVRSGRAGPNADRPR